MGALHRGHLALVEDGLRRQPFVVVSIFVNPTQFGPNEDFARYPRNLDADLDALAPLLPEGAGAVFAPEAAEMYPPGEQTRVRVGAVAEPLCGRFRPGHFEGVATVVAKLFCAVGPCSAVFGRKDYQQLLVIRRMARDLLMDVEVVGHPIVREPDGLAMSSRNVRLDAEQRKRSTAIYKTLLGLREGWMTDQALRFLEDAGFRADYIAVVDRDTLQPVPPGSGNRIALIAAFMGEVRLIDNMLL